MWRWLRRGRQAAGGDPGDGGRAADAPALRTATSGGGPLAARGQAAAEEPAPLTPIGRTFAEYFATWGLFLPAAAEATRTPGYLLGHGWSVRWRWHEDGAAEFLASHRMTNERWHRIAPDGALSTLDVPFEAMIFPPDATDEERDAIEREYRAAWSAHGAAVEEAGMNPIKGRPPVPSDLTGPALQTWMLDGSDWQSSPLRPAA